MEIAKIRAFRLIWAKVVEAYNPKSKDAAKAFIHSTTAKWNMTVYDPYVNMLRATTESMSAVLGGADSISVKPFDAPFKKAGTFSNRISRNTQIILKEEAYFDKIVDPAAGSYYIESLTDSIATEVWKEFLKIENEGGYSASLKKGIIQTEIEAMANKRLTDVSTRRDTILGTNQYPNFTEQELKNIDNEVFEEVQQLSANPIVKPLMKFRLAMHFEALRLKTEKSGRRPKVFMLTIGSLAMRLARSQFSCNFFGVAGFEVIDNNGFKTIDDGLKAAFDAKAEIIVLCSSDEEYATFAPEAFEKIGSKAILVIAGAPACMDELKAKGIANFINVKSNVLETLTFYQNILKIKE
jgi:methylmalonyl-CoA mutase